MAPSWRIDFARPGTHLVAITTEPSEIVLPAEKFNDYLRAEGLAAVLRERARSGRSETPGRERYRRNIKTLVQVGARGDATFAARTGQRLEIMPRSDPARAHSGKPLAFTLLFDARPLPQALVKFWHRSGDRVQVLSATTDRNGQVAFTPLRTRHLDGERGAHDSGDGLAGPRLGQLLGKPDFRSAAMIARTAGRLRGQGAPPFGLRAEFSRCGCVMPQRGSAASSATRASTQRAPSGVLSFFQNGAWVFR